MVDEAARELSKDLQRLNIFADSNMPYTLCQVPILFCAILRVLMNCLTRVLRHDRMDANSCVYCNFVQRASPYSTTGRSSRVIMSERADLLAMVASLYYKLHQSQSQIAERLGVSSSKVS